MRTINYYIKAIAYFRSMENLGWAQFDKRQGIFLSPKIPADHSEIALEAAQAYSRVIYVLCKATKYTRIFSAVLFIAIIIRLLASI